MNPPKRKNDWLKFEHLKIGHTYAFNFNPDYQPETLAKTVSMKFASFDRDILDFCRRTYELFSHYTQICNVTLWLETSPSARFHFHGLLTIVDLRRFPIFIQMIEKMGASRMREQMDVLSDTLLYDDIGKYESWYAYCTKQKHIWEGIFKNSTLKYPMDIPRKQAKPKNCAAGPQAKPLKEKTGTVPQKVVRLESE